MQFRSEQREARFLQLPRAASVLDIDAGKKESHRAEAAGSVTWHKQDASCTRDQAGRLACLLRLAGTGCNAAVSVPCANILRVNAASIIRVNVLPNHLTIESDHRKSADTSDPAPPEELWSYCHLWCCRGGRCRRRQHSRQRPSAAVLVV